MHPETARPDGRGSGVDDFLQREQAALREIEALSLTKKKEHAHERHGGTERQRRDFDFATLERHLMSPAGQQQLASLEEAVKDDGFAFLAEKYVTKVEETAEMAEARLKNEQRVAAQEARQRTYLARCKTEADRYWAEVEVKEKAEYEAMILEMEEYIFTLPVTSNV